MSSEREKALAGEPYVAADPELAGMNMRAQTLLHAFNTPPPAAFEERRALIRQLFGAAGTNCEVKQPFFCDYGAHIYAGDNLFVNYDCVILDCNVVTRDIPPLVLAAGNPCRVIRELPRP